MIGERIRETKQLQRKRGEFLGGPPPFGWIYDANHNRIAAPEQQLVLRRIKRLADAGLSPYKISADLAERGTKLSHMTVRKIIARNAGAA